MKKLTISLLALITILSCGATTVSAARFRTYRYHTPRVRRTPRYRIRKSEYSYSHKMSSDHNSYSHHDNMSSYRSSSYSNTGSTATFTGSQTDDVLNNQISKKKYRNDYYRQSIITNPWIWAMLINHTLDIVIMRNILEAIMQVLKLVSKIKKRGRLSIKHYLAIKAHNILDTIFEDIRKDIVTE